VKALGVREIGRRPPVGSITAILKEVVGQLMRKVVGLRRYLANKGTHLEYVLPTPFRLVLTWVVLVPGRL